MPQKGQHGSLVLRRKGLERCAGAWMPYWRYDVICLEWSLAEQVAERFDVELREVAWHVTPPGEAWQIVAPTVGHAWFDPHEVRQAAIARHGETGATCVECGVWRWMPMLFRSLPPLRIQPSLGHVDVAASPEWFGAGWKAFRQILLRRELAELIAAASPRDFKIRTVTFTAD
ncbi:hypothetical protein EF847_11140 [Actinobacteria bacterium YIM 96077]|uniref:Uncharacterized protein n=2 Tax=Phytoactinopolyspora halophila TaxID=1981511 RepID=A0A329QZ44_9ACTN|nr:hypothetical protein EF847_11140 [Actinobacteria bacterium YIM 96077]RAW17595.1 hypothetical protein DPM12_06280 [Phytoactinopolyspora halophila]